MSKNENGLSLTDYLHILTSAALEYEEKGGVVEFTEQTDGVTLFLPLVAYDATERALFVPTLNDGGGEGEA